jgi:predicted dehydrogenase
MSIKPEEPLKNEIVDFMNAIKTSNPPLISGEGGLETLKIALAAVDSYKGNKKIIID